MTEGQAIQFIIVLLMWIEHAGFLFLVALVGFALTVACGRMWQAARKKAR